LDRPFSAAVDIVAMPDSHETAKMLREKATRCRLWADAVTHRELSGRLRELAAEFDERAAALEARERCPP
jgi:hypothetical protein